jgi:mono/diheme cytochrome c family protein
MPVWRDIFLSADGTTERTDARIENLVKFIASLQVSAAAGEVPSGAVLYRIHCSSCHGTYGRSDRAAGSGAVRPPDVSTLAVRHGGSFPNEMVRRAIAGDPAGAHRAGGMPIWGNTFKYARGGNPDPAAARIDALVEYLWAIQESPQ